MPIIHNERVIKRVKTALSWPNGVTKRGTHDRAVEKLRKIIAKPDLGELVMDEGKRSEKAKQQIAGLKATNDRLLAEGLELETRTQELEALAQRKENLVRRYLELTYLFAVPSIYIILCMVAQCAAPLYRLLC